MQVFVQVPQRDEKLWSSALWWPLLTGLDGAVAAGAALSPGH
jgi:hypothetical protein